MSGWVRDEIWLGLPLRRIECGTRALRDLGIDVGRLFQSREGLSLHAAGITTMLAAGGLIPEGARLVGIRYPYERDVITFTLTHPDFPAVEEGTMIPLDEPAYTHEKREQMRRAWAAFIEVASITLEVLRGEEAQAGR